MRFGIKLVPYRYGLCICLALAGCGGGSGGGASPSVAPPTEPEPPTVADQCGVEAQKQFVFDVASDWYLWYDEMAQVSADDFDSADEYLDALTAPLAVDARDPGFSYLTTRQADEAGFTSGAYVGFGFRYDLAPGNRFYFSDVFQSSPAGDADLFRGDEVLAIDVGNGFETINQLANRGVTTEELFGVSEAGVERGFRVVHNGEQRDVVLVKRELDTPPLAVEPMLLARDGLPPVGYLNLRSFIRTANDPLAEASTLFRDAGVTDLVIDLRYNGGGLLDVADRMLDLFGGIVAEGQESFRLAHNDKRRDEDANAIFAPAEGSMEPLRVAFITTQSTASASELLINSLAPHMEVVLVGEDTLGKAVGQYAFDQPDCDTRLRLVAFEIVNGEGLGGYYTGLVDTGRFTLCPAADDFTRPFGDVGEESLATALGWLNDGVCASVATQALDSSRQLYDSMWSVAAQREQPFGRSPFVQ